MENIRQMLQNHFFLYSWHCHNFFFGQNKAGVDPQSGFFAVCVSWGDFFISAKINQVKSTFRQLSLEQVFLLQFPLMHFSSENCKMLNFIKSILKKIVPYSTYVQYFNRAAQRIYQLHLTLTLFVSFDERRANDEVHNNKGFTETTNV